jgi:hypothetical protein
MKKKLIISLALLVIIVLGIWYYKSHKNNSSYVAPETPQEEQKQTLPKLSIETKDIKEENFTGKVAVVSGDSVLAEKANAYIESAIADFKKQADTDVPAMRKEFGADSPTAQYEIDIDAKDVKSSETESIVLLVYTYTGGAHGSSVYKVFTVDADSKIMSLSSIVKAGQEKAFTEFVKKELLKWKPSGDVSPVFPEDVDALTFNSFGNWALTDTSLIIYFDQYAVGPGALGAVPFSISLDKIKNFLN